MNWCLLFLATVLNYSGEMSQNNCVRNCLYHLIAHELHSDLCFTLDCYVTHTHAHTEVNLTVCAHIVVYFTVAELKAVNSDRAGEIFLTTFKVRNQWVTKKDGPSIKEVINKFPYWKFPEEVSLYIQQQSIACKHFLFHMF